MKFRRLGKIIGTTCFVFTVTFGLTSNLMAQEPGENISTVVIDSAPKKLYTELY